MSHRVWWLISIFALVIGAAIEFDPLPWTQAQSSSTAQPASPPASIAAQKPDPRRS